MKSCIPLLLGMIVLRSCTSQPAAPDPTTRTSVTGHQLRDFEYSSGTVGGVITIYGRPPIRGKPTLHNWLYLMIICPGVQAAESHKRASGITLGGGAAVEFHSDWETVTGSARVSLRWDRRSDSIAIGSQRFQRKNGNVFVVVRKPSGELTTQQCGTLGPLAECPEVAHHIRQQLPTDEFVALAAIRE
jgi:hypothetical protein